MLWRHVQGRHNLEGDGKIRDCSDQVTCLGQTVHCHGSVNGKTRIAALVFILMIMTMFFLCFNRRTVLSAHHRQ